MTMIEDFSKGYWLVNADVVPFSGEKVATSRELGYEMLRHTRYPLLKVGSEHHRVCAQSSVPVDTIAVPSDAEPERSDHALLAKDETVGRIEGAGRM